jgi:hypothetical protein
MKGVLAALLVLCIALAADQHYYRGLHTDGAIKMLRQIQHSFKW